MRQFAKTSLAFTLGLLCVLFVTDQVLRMRVESRNGGGLLAPEIYVSVHTATVPSQSVHTIYLGDSVAHQIFPPGKETRPDERYLTCNQAISMAGQCYLLEDSLRSCPHLKDVYLFYYPGSFANDLQPPLTNDYFCGFFHRPGQIREIFAVTKDWRLAAVQTGRLVFPYILGTNSGIRANIRQPAVPQPKQNMADSTPPAEPLLDLLNHFTKPRSYNPYAPHYDDSGRREVVLSPVSQHFLAKMRRLCREHGITLHILPCPCSDAQTFTDPQHVYQGPILYVDSTHFGDAIHLREQYLPGVREQIVQMYQLNAPARAQAAVGMGEK